MPLVGRTFHTIALFAVAALPAPAQQQSATSSVIFAQFVDRYLGDFARRHPSIAAGNGLHQHDALLDDFTARAIHLEIAALKRDQAQLERFDTAKLTPDERVDRRILLGIIDGWLLEQETLQSWRRNPMLYASALSDGVHNLMTVESDPPAVRMRLSWPSSPRYRRCSPWARTNVVNPPRIFAERGAAFMRGASEMLGKDLDLAFAGAGTPRGRAGGRTIPPTVDISSASAGCSRCARTTPRRAGRRSACGSSTSG